MLRKRHSVEEIVSKLRQADVLLAQRQTGADVARLLDGTETTYYRWRSEYCGLKGDGRIVPSDAAKGHHDLISWALFSRDKIQEAQFAPILEMCNSHYL